jgi:WD40 repeat protein
VRLVSHKLSSRPYEAVVLAQVLEGGSGVVWAVAVSHDGAFLATAGQDCVLRVWQLTASRWGGFGGCRSSVCIFVHDHLSITFATQ